MMGFSFSALAESVYKVNSTLSYFPKGSGCSVSTGQSYSAAYFQSCASSATGVCRSGACQSSTPVRADVQSGYIRVFTASGWGGDWLKVTKGTCPDGESVNPQTGQCGEPPICEPPSILNPDTLECFTPAFCDRESTTESLF